MKLYFHGKINESGYILQGEVHCDMEERFTGQGIQIKQKSKFMKCTYIGNYLKLSLNHYV